MTGLGGESADAVTSGPADPATALGERLDEICRRFEPLDWPEFFAWRRSNRTLPRNAVLFTFDDGLKEHAELAGAVLRERGMHGTFLVQGEVLVTGRLNWANQLRALRTALGDDVLACLVCDWLEANRELTVDALESRPGGAPPGRPAGGGEQEATATLVLDPESWMDLVDPQIARRCYPEESQLAAELSYLLTYVLPIELRNRVIEQLFATHLGDPREYARRTYMDWEQLVALERSGHTIGGHGFAHEPYARLAPAEQQQDVRRVAAMLRDSLGPGLRPFSYPLGSFTETAAQACARCGFTHAFTTRPGWIAEHDPPLRLCRVRVDRLEGLLGRIEKGEG